MKHVTKPHQKQINEIVGRLHDAAAEIETAYEAQCDATSTLNSKIDEYNSVLADAREVVGEITEDMTEYRDGRSDNWREGEKGRAFDDWLGAWNDLELSDIASVDEADKPDTLHGDALAGADVDFPED